MLMLITRLTVFCSYMVSGHPLMLCRVKKPGPCFLFYLMVALVYDLKNCNMCESHDSQKNKIDHSNKILSWGFVVTAVIILLGGSSTACDFTVVMLLAVLSMPGQLLLNLLHL